LLILDSNYCQGWNIPENGEELFSHIEYLAQEKRGAYYIIIREFYADFTVICLELKL
jgi:hypothetical protein